MSIEYNKFSGFHKDYLEKNLNNLSSRFNSVDVRIKGAKWLIKNLVQSDGVDYAWQCRVIKLLCTKTAADSNSSDKSKNSQCQLIVDLIKKMILIPPNQTQQNETPLLTLPNERKAEASQEKFKELFFSGDIKGESLLHMAVKMKNIEMLKILAVAAPDLYKQTILIPDSNGYTLLHVAAMQNDLSTFTFLAESEPLLFKKNILMQTDEEESVMHLAVISKAVEIATFIQKVEPSLFRDLTNSMNSSRNTPFHSAIIENDLKMLTLLEHAAPDHFKENLTKKNSIGETPLHLSFIDNDIELLEFLFIKAPEQCRAAVTIPNSEGMTLLHMAADSKKFKSVEMLIHYAPQECRTASLLMDDSGQTPLHIAASGPKESIELLWNFAPKEFETALIMQDEENATPVLYAAKVNRMDNLEKMEQYTPSAFSEALAIQDVEGNTPLIWATLNHNVPLLKLMIRINPAALYLQNNEYNSVYFFLKAIRPENYSTVTQLFKDQIAIKELHKEQFKRLALSHSLYIEGRSPLIQSETFNLMATLDELSGHFSAQWFHLMSKNFSKFQESYPFLFSLKTSSLMKHLLELGANPSSFSVEDKMNRLNVGLPLLITAGYAKIDKEDGHECTFLLWKDQFIICDRGGSSKYPIRVFHFDPKKMHKKVFKTIHNLSLSGTEKEYDKYIHVTLREQLNFRQTESDLKLQNVCPLPDQTTGHCTFVSPITGIYAFLLLANARLVDQKGCLVNPIPLQTKIAAKKTIFEYQTWLSNLQLDILESNIPRPDAQGAFEPDHQLIVEALRKTHLLPLDSFSEEKLESLTSLYLSSLNEKEQIQLNTDLAYWKMLAKQPLL